MGLTGPLTVLPGGWAGQKRLKVSGLACLRAKTTKNLFEKYNFYKFFVDVPSEINILTGLFNYRYRSLLRIC
jgi:hypothetical protein